MRPNDMPRPFAPDHSDGDDLVKRLRNSQPRKICEHGSQAVKCPICENAQLEDQIELMSNELEKVIRERDAAMRELAALRERIEKAPVAIMDTRDVLGICAPTEEDFTALYAIQGHRVRLVRED